MLQRPLPLSAASRPEAPVDSNPAVLVCRSSNETCAFPALKTLVPGKQQEEVLGGLNVDALGPPPHPPK